MTAAVELRPVRLSGIAVEAGSRSRPRWVAIFVRPGFAYHVTLPMPACETSKDEATAYARQYAVPEGCEVVEP